VGTEEPLASETAAMESFCAPCFCVGSAAVGWLAAGIAAGGCIVVMAAASDCESKAREGGAREGTGEASELSLLFAFALDLLALPPPVTSCGAAATVTSALSSASACDWASACTKVGPTVLPGCVVEPLFALAAAFALAVELADCACAAVEPCFACEPVVELVFVAEAERVEDPLPEAFPVGSLTLAEDCVPEPVDVCVVAKLFALASVLEDEPDEAGAADFGGGGMIGDMESSATSSHPLRPNAL